MWQQVMKHAVKLLAAWVTHKVATVTSYATISMTAAVMLMKFVIFLVCSLYIIIYIIDH